MLVLTRKIGESIIIDDDIKVQIIRIHGNQIRIGISAPESILIFREEVYRKILAERRNKTDMDPAVKPRDDGSRGLDPEGLARDDKQDDTAGVTED
jgi:carbon storage regulator